MRNEQRRTDVTVKILVSIINYQTAELTIDAAESALAALEKLTGEVVIVDNASTDDSADRIAAWINARGSQRIHLVRASSNSGFSGGHNIGMSFDRTADFFLILNSDALLRTDFFEPLLKEADRFPRAGLLAPQLEDPDGTPQTSCFRFASPVSELIRGAGTGPVTRIFGRKAVPLPLPPEQAAIEWMSFACILLRREMVNEIGLMDEDYFLYFEDAEYGLRARRAQWGARYVRQARAVHFRGGSGPVKALEAAKKRLPRYYWQSRSRFFRQAHGPLGPLAANMCWIIGRVIAWLRVFVGKPVPKAHDREWRDIWTDFLSPLSVDWKRKR